jgi:hypothetical protein
MRENRPYGSEGGEGDPFPTPIGFDFLCFGCRHPRHQSYQRSQLMTRHARA